MSTLAAEYWGPKYFDASFHRAEWQAHPHALKRLCQLQSGMMRDDWFAKTYLKNGPAKRALGVGVGTADTELSLLSKGYVEHFDLFDISSVGLDHAKAHAESLGFGDRVTCHCSDILTAALPPNSFDLVTFVASLHHMGDLETTLWTANSALKSDGILWAANEYVGPDRFAYPEEHVRFVRHFFRNLPERFRKFGEITFPSPEEVAKADPSEAPCSSQILPVMRRIFPRLEVLDLYGSFAFMVSWGLNHDAIYESEEGADIIKLILGLDQGLVECGALPGYFAHLVARKTTGQQERAIRSGLHPEGWIYKSLKAGRDTLRRAVSF
jgi:ubiquinone/menaquinone biosynthesis C-methylase UbiE